MLTKLVPDLLFRFDTQFGNRPATGAQPPNQPLNFVKVEDRRFRLRHPVTVGGQITPIRAFNPVTIGPGTPKTFAAATGGQQLHTIGLDRVPAPPGFPGAMPFKVIHVTHAAGAGAATPYV